MNYRAALMTQNSQHESTNIANRGKRLLTNVRNKSCHPLKKLTETKSVIEKCSSSADSSDESSSSSSSQSSSSYNDKTYPISRSRTFLHKDETTTRCSVPKEEAASCRQQPFADFAKDHCLSKLHQARKSPTLDPAPFPNNTESHSRVGFAKQIMSTSPCGGPRSSISPNYPTYLPPASPSPCSTYYSHYSREFQQNLSTLNHLVRVTHILDLDGFVLQDGFVCQEMALIEIGGLTLHSEHFKLGRTFEQLNARDAATVCFVTQNIHGMPFQDHPHDRLEQFDVSGVLKVMLHQSNIPLDEIVVGYKGGYLELCLLNHLSVKSVDLTQLGCPRFDEFFDLPKYSNLLLETKTVLNQLSCDRHTQIKPSSRYKIHCCKHEVFMFRQWYLREYLRL